MDIVDDFLERLRKHLGEDLCETQMGAIEQDIRGEWGGSDRGYIRKDSTKMRARKLGEALAEGVGVADSFVKTGISKSAGYRLLSRKAR
jgi:hypothetical protein